MNAQKITFHKNAIKHNESEIARLESELQNPRIRKVSKRHEQITSLNDQIAQSRGLLLVADAL